MRAPVGIIPDAPASMTHPDPATFGVEYIVDAFGCAPQQLASPAAVQAVVNALVNELRLHAIGDPLWHVFGGPGGMSGVVLLAESHLTVHTFPERGYAAFNLYHCRDDVQWPWAFRLRELLGCQRIAMRTVVRGDESACIATAS